MPDRKTEYLKSLLDVDEDFEDSDEEQQEEGERRFVLLEVVPESQTSSFQEDSYEEAMTEDAILHMLARKLGYTLTKRKLINNG
jgi:DNA-binding response OmpR family regulator